MLEIPAIRDDLAARLAKVAPRASGSRKWFEIKAATEDEAEVLIYGEISFWEVDPDYFVRALRTITASVIHVRINSSGGNVFGGVAIYNALLRHPARIIVHVDGIAASIASFIAMAGDEIRMGEGSFMMIHAPHWVAIGNAQDFRDAAELLDKVQLSMAGVYASRSGRSIDKIQELMTGPDAWLTAEEAVEEGFADIVDSGRSAVAARGDLSMYSNVPKQLRGQGDGGREKPQTIREVEAVLRDAGCSREEAKAIAARGYKAAPDPRDEADERVNDPTAEEGLDRLQAAILNARVVFATR